MIQKTIRFYERSPDDMKALEKLNNCRKFGYTSCREMIIATIKAYSIDTDRYSSLEDIDMDTLADKIAARLKNENINISANRAEIKEKQNETVEDKYSKALDFIDSL